MRNFSGLRIFGNSQQKSGVLCRGPTGELERDFGQWHGVTGQREMASNWQRAGLDGML